MEWTRIYFSENLPKSIARHYAVRFTYQIKGKFTKVAVNNYWLIFGVTTEQITSNNTIENVANKDSRCYRAFNLNTIIPFNKLILKNVTTGCYYLSN